METDKNSFDISNHPSTDVGSERLTPRTDNNPKYIFDAQVPQTNSSSFEYPHQMIYNLNRSHASEMNPAAMGMGSIQMFQDNNHQAQGIYGQSSVLQPHMMPPNMCTISPKNQNPPMNQAMYTQSIPSQQMMQDSLNINPVESSHPLSGGHMGNRNTPSATPTQLMSSQNIPQQFLNYSNPNVFIQNVPPSPQMIQLPNQMPNFQTQQQPQMQQYMNQSSNLQESSPFGVPQYPRAQVPISFSSPTPNDNIQTKSMPYLMQTQKSNMSFTMKQDPMGGEPSSNQTINTSQIPTQTNSSQTSNQTPNMMPHLMQNPNVIQMDGINLQNKLNVLASQIGQVQNSIASVSTSGQPSNAQLVNFLNQRLFQLKTVYMQLLMQLQTLQQRSNMVSMQQNVQQPHQMMNQPPSYSYMPQQMGMQNQMPPQHMNPNNHMTRASLVPNQMAMRMNPSMQNPSLGMPPGLARYQGGRPMYNYNPNYGQPTSRVLPQMEGSKGRRSLKGGRRRRHYSSESEEEEDITSSDNESTSALTPASFHGDETEVRRSSRIHNSRSYVSEIADDSDSEDASKKAGADSPSANAQDLIPFQPTEQTEGKLMLIDRILADRIKMADLLPGDLIIPPTEDDEEFFVKFKYYSYIHCEWCNKEELKRRDRNALSKIKRYKGKKKESPFLYIDEDAFNPDYVEIDRVLDIKQTPDPSNPSQMTTCYLIKWCSLPYDEATWEFEEAVDELPIEEYKGRNTIPSPEALAYKPKLHSYQWQKITKTPVYKNGNVLREYQLEGINWLLYEYCVGTNCILADEMGLGKTIQSISFLVEIRKIGMRGPFLIVAPLSTISNWYREFIGWSDFNCVVLHGAAPSRNIIHRYELYYRNEENEIIPDVCKFEVLITTYEMILSENKFLSSIRWRIAIIDEAHRLKNRKCKLLNFLGNLHIEHRVLLTGTPLQNTLDELLSLLHFLDPIRAATLDQLMQQSSGRLETNQQVQQIQAFLKPVILRRLKEDVEKNIAPKEETIIEVEMTTIQKKVYRGVLERNLSFLSKGVSSANLPNLMNIMMELRKCCNHPFLINGVEDKILSEYASANQDLDRQMVFRKALIESSGKLVLVDKLLPKLRDNGHRMLIFSQMVRVLDLLEEYLVSHGFLFERIDGGVRGNLRQAAIDRFSKPDSDRSVFLLCTKAGGLGINLTAADTVIIFDSDWNPQNDIQAQARCHRIGQNKAVKVYRLICRKTYEREMFDRASLKLGLDKAVLQDINTSMDEKGQLSNTRTQLSKKEVEELLRKGAYAAVMDEDLDASAKFCSEDIEQILERRATVITLAGATKGSSFAKASFNADVGDEGVDLDDPDFWQKWARSAKVDPEKSRDFIDDKPRIRKVVRPLDGDDDYEIEYRDLVNQQGGRRRDVTHQRTCWIKKECLRVEKHLLIYGWGRWKDILINATLKTNMTVNDVEQISKSILIIAWLFNKSDTTFNDFIEKAMRMTTLKSRQNELDSEDHNYQPYGKRTRSKKLKGKARKNDKVKICLMQSIADWRNTTIEALVFDDNYKRHLQHCATKILIRLRLLFYIEYYILRDCKEDIILGVHVDDISVPLLTTNRNAATFPPWWDDVCDRSLIVGTFRYGFEKYTHMKTDKQLCFSQHIPETRHSQDVDCNKKRGRKRKLLTPDQSDDDAVLESQLGDDLDKLEEVNESNSNLTDLPPVGELNTYLKRLVMAYWKQRVKTAHNNKVDVKKSEVKMKWSKKEELNFYKVVTRFSILYIDGAYVWENFRKYGHFDKKDDKLMTSYYETLIERCEQLVKTNNITNIDTNNDISPPTDGCLTLRMSLKILQRIKLFQLVRQSFNLINIYEIVSNAPKVTDAFPQWWNTQADTDLIRATFMYGIKNDDMSIFLDTNFMFRNIVEEKEKETSPNMDINTLNVNQVKNIIKWPKPSILVNRILTLCHLVNKSSIGNNVDSLSIISSSNASNEQQKSITLNHDKSSSIMMNESNEQINNQHTTTDYQMQQD